jgi:tryptophanyl-tRNA synthetase
MKKRSLTGIKPTGTPHLGNYLASIRPAIELSKEYQAFYFIADYHALTTVKSREELKSLTYEVAATWLASGLNSEEVIFYKQSDIPELFEFSWILSCFTPKGLLNRAHAYKAAVDKNIEAEKNPDEGINTGLFTYPVLMASDILLFSSDIVPVGLDQKQHVEIARDIATMFNNNYGELLVLPEPLINEEVMTVPGTDGRKMSKNYGNTIPVFMRPEQLKKRVMSIVTDSRRPEEPKDPDTCNVFSIFRHFASEEERQTIRRRYIEGGLAYSEIKTRLYELLNEQFVDVRDRYYDLLNDKKQIDKTLSQGAERARSIASPLMAKIRKKIGVV